MDIKEFAIESARTLLVVTGTTVLAYAGLRLAQKLYGPIEVTIKEKK